MRSQRKADIPGADAPEAGCRIYAMFLILQAENIPNAPCLRIELDKCARWKAPTCPALPKMDFWGRVLKYENRKA